MEKVIVDYDPNTGMFYDPRDGLYLGTKADFIPQQEVPQQPQSTGITANDLLKAIAITKDSSLAIELTKGEG